MKHNHVELFLLLFVLAGCASSITPPERHEQSISTIADVETWLKGYYLYPRPDLFPSVLEVMEREKVLTGDQNAQAPFLGVFALMFRMHPHKVGTWAAQADGYSDDLRRTLWMGLWLSNSPGSRDYLEERRKTAAGQDAEYLDVLLNISPYSLEFLAPETPENLDTLWGAFFVTGQDIYILNVIKALEYYDQREVPDLFLTAVSAKWSLKSNAARHPRVLMVCRKASGGKDAAAAHLADIVGQVDGRTVWVDERAKGIDILRREFSIGAFDY